MIILDENYVPLSMTEVEYDVDGVAICEEG